MPLYIDNELMPEPAAKGILFSDEKVWSANTARSTSGKMNGSIIAWKKTRSFKFPPLSSADLNKLNGKISEKKEWHTVKYTDSSNNTIFSFECYFGTPTYNFYSAAKDLRYFTDYSVDAIER